MAEPNLREEDRIKVEKMGYEGELMGCPRCHLTPFLRVTVLGTVVYLCPDCLYFEEPWERGD